MDSGQFTVQAQYSFKGSNNDELCFKKGDIITLTQREDGGWWEGTLGEMTGWFPSNYVKEYVGKWGDLVQWMRFSVLTDFFFHLQDPFPCQRPSVHRRTSRPSGRSSSAICSRVSGLTWPSCEG